MKLFHFFERFIGAVLIGVAIFAMLRTLQGEEIFPEKETNRNLPECASAVLNAIDESIDCGIGKRRYQLDSDNLASIYSDLFPANIISLDENDIRSPLFASDLTDIIHLDSGIVNMPNDTTYLFPPRIHIRREIKTSDVLIKTDLMPGTKYIEVSKDNVILKVSLQSNDRSEWVSAQSVSPEGDLLKIVTLQRHPVGGSGYYSDKVANKSTYFGYKPYWIRNKMFVNKMFVKKRPPSNLYQEFNEIIEPLGFQIKFDVKK